MMGEESLDDLYGLIDLALAVRGGDVEAGSAPRHHVDAALKQPVDECAVQRLVVEADEVTIVLDRLVRELHRGDRTIVHSARSDPEALYRRINSLCKASPK